MRIKLNKIKMENFKGLKLFEARFDGKNAMIRAENGVGKTTVLDAYLWLFFGKDSTGRTDFAVRPLDGDNQPIKGLVLAVEADLLIDGITHTLRKEQQEHVVKDQLRGYTLVCTIDEVPKKVGEFQEWVANVMPETIFKMLTDLSQFNSKLHWSERRIELLEIAGKIPTPAGFDGLLELLKGRTIEEYQKVLSEQRKAHKKERDGINPRIDELHRGLKDYAQQAGDSEVELIAKRENAQEDVVELDKEIQNLRGKEKERQNSYKQINELNEKLLHQENIVRNQQGPTEALNDERAGLEQDHADKTQGLVNLQNLIQQGKSAIESADNQIAASLLALAGIKDEHKKAKDKPADETCFTCGQKLPADQIADAENKRQTALGNIIARSDKVKNQIAETKAKKESLQDELNKIIAEEKTLVEELKAAEAAKDKRIAEITAEIAKQPKAKPEDDAEWQRLVAERQEINDGLGEPVSKQLEKLQGDRDAKADEIAGLNKALAQFDNIKKTKARITELEAREKELAQLIAEVEGKLEEIDKYKVEQSKMVEAAVNGRFQHVEWKLFKYNLNGSMDDTCEATLNGVPYPDMSAGQQIYCSIDCINTLSDHYAVEVPLFVDHSESMTLPIEADSQVIELEAVVGIDELEVLVEEDSEVAEIEGKVVA